MNGRAVRAVSLVVLELAVGCNALVGIPSDVVDVADAGDAATVKDAGIDVSIMLMPHPDSGRDSGSDVSKPTPDGSAGDAPRDVAPPDATEGGFYTGGPGGGVAVSSGLQVQNWCVVTAAGHVYCWGDNETGQLGTGTGLSSATPLEIAGFTDPVVDVSVGLFTICALTKPGGVLCWGYGNDGELGNGMSTDVTMTPTAVVGMASGVTQVSSNNLVSCAIKADGSAWCWGAGPGGVLGNGTVNDSESPTQVLGLTSGVTSIAVGVDAACAVKNGAVFCWGGYQGSGELGNGTLDGMAVPVAVPSLASGVKQVGVGNEFVCALTDAGGVSCWGYGEDGELGNGELSGSSIPVEVMGLQSGVTSIAVGNETTCAIKDDDSVWCWGYGDDGQLGAGTISFTSPGATGLPESTVPVQVHGFSHATSITVGNAPCITTLAGQVYCWGLTAEVALFPTQVVNLPTVAATVTLGGSEDSAGFGCTIAGAGAEVLCWGGNAFGQLGDGNTANASFPVVNANLIEMATSISSGAAADFACGIALGLTECWGDNSAGQLGDGTTSSSSTPVAVQVPDGVDFTQVAAGYKSACALTSTGDVYCWGDNSFGELGDGTTTAHHTPVEVQGLSGAEQVSVGIEFACAVLSDHTIDCWGNNVSGSLGNGTADVSEVPGPVSSIATATAVSCGWYGCCALTSAGTVFCWGSNRDGELGTGGGSSGSLLPLQVTGITSGATAVATGESGACAIVNGGVECWGSSALGDGISTEQFSPSAVTDEQFTALTGVTAIAVGYETACAVVQGGIQCWGSNTAGQLGSGAPSNELSPTLVAGFP